MSTMTKTPVTPERIMQMNFGFIATRALASALELDLFTLIHKGARTLEALAEQSGASLRGLRRLVGAIAALGFVSWKDGQLELAPDAEMFLVSTVPTYLGGLVTHHTHVGWPRWGNLTEAVRHGATPHVGVESDEDGGAFFAGFVDALFNLNYPAARAVASHLGGSPKDAVDIGAGSAVWSLALAELHPELKTVAVDRQEVFDKVTSAFVQRLGVADRYHLVEGNFREVDLGESRFDVAYLGHILHSEGPARSADLLKRIHRSLRPGGTLVIAEMVADEHHSERVMPQLFGLNMLVHTEEGEVFSEVELEAMAREAGFASHEWVATPSPSPVLLVRKAP